MISCCGPSLVGSELPSTPAMGATPVPRLLRRRERPRNGGSAESPALTAGESPLTAAATRLTDQRVVSAARRGGCLDCVTCATVPDTFAEGHEVRWPLARESAIDVPVMRRP